MSNTDRVCSPSRSAMAPRGRMKAGRSESGRCGRLPAEIRLVGRSFSVEYSTPVLRAGEIDWRPSRLAIALADVRTGPFSPFTIETSRRKKGKTKK